MVGGSLFAILTSAAMGGFGFGIVAGAVWGFTSAGSWGAFALWKWWNQKGGEAGDGEGDVAGGQVVKKGKQD